MAAAAAELDFEKAARLRDDLGALRRAVEKQAVVLGDGTDADVVGIAADELLASVQVFHVRGGRVRGQRGWIVDVDADSAGPAGLAVAGGEFPAAVLRRPGRRRRRHRGAAGDPGAGAAQPGGGHRGGTDRVAVRPARIPGVAAGRRSAATSGRWPRPSTRNAAEALTQHRLKRASDLTARSAALTELGRHPRAWTSRRCGSSASTSRTCRAPTWSRRWWCSRTGCPSAATTGGSPSGSSPATTSRPSPRWCGGGSPTARAEAVEPAQDAAPTSATRRRHGAGHGAGQHRPDAGSEPTRPAGAASTRTTGRPRRFAYPPQLLVVDGGAPQVNAAATELAELGIVDVTVCGLAKRLEEVWVPGQDEPIIFPRTSEALYLLQRLRDEAHRFAITYHRAKRSKSMTVSALDNVARPGRGAPQGAGAAFRIGRRAAPATSRRSGRARIGSTPRRGRGAGGAATADRPARRRPSPVPASRTEPSTDTSP